MQANERKRTVSLIPDTVFCVDDLNTGERVDTYLASVEPDLTRARIQKLIGAGSILVNGNNIRSSHRLKAGDQIAVTMPEPLLSDIKPEKIDLDIVYEDSDVVVINKPAGMVVHPSAGHYSGTLVNALLGHFGGDDLSTIGGVIRPGLVHRLDKDTSGVMAVARNDKTHQSLSEQLKSREMSRIYLALVKGTPKNREGTVNALIGRAPAHRKRMAVLQSGGRESITHYKILQEFGKVSLLEVSLSTGRTHQIRVSLQHINNPVVGDPVYSRGIGKFPINRQALHAWKITFIHPTDKRTMTFDAPLPKDMTDLLHSFGGDASPYK